MIDFILSKTRDGRTMVEVWEDGVFIAGIYPWTKKIDIVSKYIGGSEKVADSPSQVVIYFKEEEKRR